MSTPSPADAAAALLAANRRRRRVRRWLAVGTLPLTFAALAVIVKILSMYGFAHQSVSSYLIGDSAGAVTAANGQGIANVFEPYKAPFNEGTALARAEQLSQARTHLQEALQLAHGLEVCAVRVNLSIVLERLGDAAQKQGDAATAATLYGEALTMTVDTPDECRTAEANEKSPDPDRDLSDTLDDSEDRQREKQRNAEQPNEQEQDESPEQEQDDGRPTDDSLEKLKDRMEQGQQDRDDNGEQTPGPGTDKPW